jgi:hypothetical protein
MSTPNKKVTKTTTIMQVSSAMPGEQPGDAIIETIRHGRKQNWTPLRGYLRK